MVIANDLQLWIICFCFRALFWAPYAFSFFGSTNPRHIKLLNAFTGAYLLCLTLLHLLPELYHEHPARRPQ